MSADQPRPARAPHEIEYGELPELTRALRALGSARRHAGAAQSLFFRPLLESRRKAEEARSAIAKVRAFDAKELAGALDRLLDRVVADAADTREPARRAVRAGLEERLRDYRAELSGLAQAAQLVLAADSDSVLPAWRAWTAQLQRVFICADRSWLAVQPVVESLTAKKGR